MTMHDQKPHAPTMPPQQGPLSSQGFMDFSVQVGQYIFHRGPTEWVLDRIPDGIASPLRKLVAKSIREIGKRVLLPESTLQEAMNRKLFMNTVDAQTGEPLMAEVQEEFLHSLFPHGRQDEWPQQLVICTKDVRPDPAMLRQTMLNFPEIAGDVLGKPLEVVDGFDQPVAGRVVVLGSYNTEQDIFHNAGSVLERTQEIKRDPLSIEGMSEAAIKAGDMLLELMTLRHEFGETILRDDAPEIMRHVMTHGYSQGGNIATDIFRYIRSELMSGRYEIAQDATGKHTVNTASAGQVAALLGNAYCYTIAAADVPYHGDDLTTLPPRDNSRSDGDLVISAAIGTNRKQSNYNRQWTQATPHLAHNDRLIESIGPAKRLFGLGEPRGKGYHATLGHGDDSYRSSVVEQGGDLLRERLAPRFLSSVMAADITFHDGNITLDFERGVNPVTQKPTMKAFSGALEASGIKVAPQSDPYRLSLHGQGDAATLGTIRNAMQKCGIERGDNVNTALHADIIREWLGKRLQKLPDMRIELIARENGPFLRLHPAGAEAAGPQVQTMLKRGLQRIKIPVENSGGDTLDIPLDNAVAAFRHYHQRQRNNGHAL